MIPKPAIMRRVQMQNTENTFAIKRPGTKTNSVHMVISKWELQTKKLQGTHT